MMAIDLACYLTSRIEYTIPGSDQDRVRENGEGTHEGGRLPADVEQDERRPRQGPDKRQLAAINAFAKRAGYEIVGAFYDAAVSGADPVAGRPEFARMLAALLSNGARTIIVESPDRFTRDLAQQLLGHKLLADQGLTLIAASAPAHFTEDTPTAIMVRQILGSVSEFEKTTLVAKLRASRDRKKALTGKCGGRPSHMEKRPLVVALAKALRRKRPRGAPMSLREISSALAADGHLNAAGNPFNPKSVQSMLTGPREGDLKLIFCATRGSAAATQGGASGFYGSCGKGDQATNTPIRSQLLLAMPKKPQERLELRATSSR